MDEENIKIYSYAKVWKYEKKIYNIMNWVVPTPINPHDLMCFSAMLLFMMILGRIVPFIGHIPMIIRYMMLPYIATYILRRKKLDGKNPILYLIGIVGYYLTVSGTYVENFKRVRDRSENISLSWYCSRGRRKGKKHESVSY